MSKSLASFESKLRAHQCAPTARLSLLLDRYGAALDRSDTGVGKTYIGAAIVAARDAGTLIVAPKIARTSWLRALEHMGCEADFINYEMVRTGRTPFGHWDHQENASQRTEYFRCQCCQRVVDVAPDGTPGPEWAPCYTHLLGIHCVEQRRRALSKGSFNWSSGVELLVFDEVHRCNGMDSDNSELLVAAKRQGIPVLGLSATPGVSPLHLKALGYVLGLHDLTDFPNFLRKFACRPDPRFHGWRWMAGRKLQVKLMASLNEALDARGVRVRVDSIPGFPECDITAELFDLEEGGRIDSLYKEMEGALAALAERSATDVDSPLIRILRARQKIELLKVPIFEELARDYVAKGLHVAIFVNFHASLDALRERLGCACVIDGRQKPDERQACIDTFQKDREPIVLANSAAGGICVNLHDVRGEFPRMGLVSLSFSSTETKQLFGRLRRDGGKSKSHYRCILAAGTVETQIHRSLSAKLDNLDALTDGDLMPENLRILSRG
jgi:hypothetical protein